jgi:hypothetical protein
MANKRASSKEDPLVQTIFHLTQSQKKFLDEEIGGSASAFIRKLIDAQMSGHEVEISKLRDEAKQHEAHLNIINAQISELEATDQRKQAASQTREQLLEEAAERLIKGAQVIDFKDRDFVRIFKTNLEDMNRILKGNGEPIAYEELNTLTIKKAGTRGVRIL